SGIDHERSAAHAENGVAGAEPDVLWGLFRDLARDHGHGTALHRCLQLAAVGGRVEGEVIEHQGRIRTRRQERVVAQRYTDLTVVAGDDAIAGLYLRAWHRGRILTGALDRHRPLGNLDRSRLLRG